MTISGIPLDPQPGSTISIEINVFGVNNISEGSKNVRVVKKEGTVAVIRSGKSDQLPCIQLDCYEKDLSHKHIVSKLFGGFSHSAYAVKAYPGPIQITQPTDR